MATFSRNTYLTDRIGAEEPSESTCMGYCCSHVLFFLRFGGQVDLQVLHGVSRVFQTLNHMFAKKKNEGS